MIDETGIQLDGTSIIVTGGARGIGRAMVEALAAAGADLLVVDIDDEPIHDTIRADPGHLVGHRGDISSESEIKSILDHAIQAFGHVDVVINNAGITLATIDGGDSPRSRCRFYELDPWTVQRFFEVHVMGPFLLSRAAVAGMLNQEFGRILTVTTSLDTMTRGMGAPYGPMKAASEAFTSAMAHDLAGTSVSANVLVPGGSTATRLVDDPVSRPLASLLDPSIMGPPSVWLSSRASDGINAMRFVASRWDAALPGAEAASKAGSPIAWPSDRPARGTEPPAS